MTETDIIRQYELIKRHHHDFLSTKGVKLPRLWKDKSQTRFTLNAIVLAALSRGYPNCSIVSKEELTRIVSEFSYTNDVQAGRHLAMQMGWYIKSGRRGDSESGLNSGDYILKSLTEPYPGYDANRRVTDVDFDEIKIKYGHRCACCGSVEGERHLYRKRSTTKLQKGHMDPRKSLTSDNIIPQCQFCNQSDRNKWIYNSQGRVVGIGNANVVKHCSAEMKGEIFELLKRELNR